VKRILIAIAAVLTGVSPALADTLIDNVRGVTLDAQGRVMRFEAVVIDREGRFSQVLREGDKRPKKLDYRLDGKGRVMLPGLIATDVDVMRLGLAILLSKPSATRGEGAMPNGKPRPEDRDVAVQEAQQALLAGGVTTAGVMNTTIEDWQSYRRAGDAGTLRMRLVCYAAGTEAMVLIGGPGPSPWLYDDRLKLNGVALSFDAAGNAKSDTQIRNLMSRAAMDRFQVAVRVNGAGAVSPFLDAIAELSQTYAGERRWRMLGAVPGADRQRIAALGVIAESQPALAARADADKPARAMATGGIPGLEAWTAAAAKALFAEGRFGRIVRGERADFVLVDRDPLIPHGPEGASLRVLETWVGGKPAWRAGKADDQGR